MWYSWCAAALAATIPVAPGDDVQAAIESAAPGDVVELAPGEYVVYLHIDDGGGVEGTPVTVRAAGDGVVLTAAEPTFAVLETYGVSHFVFEGFTVRGAAVALMGFFDGEDLVVRDVRFTESASRGLVANADRVVVEGCVFENFGATDEAGGRQGVVAWETSELTVTGSTFAVAGGGVWLGGNGLDGDRVVHGATITGNTFTADPNAAALPVMGVVLQGAEDVTIGGNVFEGLPQSDDFGGCGVVAAPEAEVPGLVARADVRGNRFVDVGAALCVDASAGDVSDVAFLRNLVVGADRGVTFAGGGAAVLQSTWVDVADLVVGPPGGSQAFVNHVVVGSGAASWPDALTARHSCGEPPVAGTGDVSADPRFNDADAGDYTLADDSPCIGAGEDLGLDDYVGAPDIGAFESDVVGGGGDDDTADTGGDDDGRKCGCASGTGGAAAWALVALFARRRRR